MFSFGTIGRTLAKMSRTGVVAAYGLAAGATLGAAMYGANTHDDLLVRLGALSAALLTAVLVAVTTWHRRETIISAAILLALAWTSARIIGVCCATLLLRGTLSGVGFALLGVVFGLPIAMLEAMLVGGLLVAVLRRLRPPGTAPSTENSPGMS